ncbi:protein kinase [Amorphoplanes digitatis]|uniref:non-specific serine/threonine protein kinase n=1 Tax=Actinoplanes digitatis TaxID=1868 RepID=A0A7W7MPY4_9ACTN|nr:protein kinase [Actinoplanes digitatis]MBB4762578.1 hypothetical protein [Actinoplanes digitatis]GID91922.1 hypothetical protein Adi01nite_13340 [Actinoplanes digitatis]
MSIRLGGRYEVGELLGAGGMGVVYRGHDLRLGRDVAVKMPHPRLGGDEIETGRFRREVQNTAALSHPGIVAVYDAGDEPMPNGDSVPYLIMELVDGRSLRDFLRAGRPEPRQALWITAEVCAALEFSHRHGLVHRDIKPGNVMLTYAGQVKVMDFGIARASSSGSSPVRLSHAVIGTILYLSPEQARGAPVDARTDVYAAGCLLYTLLSGRPPFLGDDPISIAYKHVREDPVPPSRFNPDVRGDVDAVVLTAMNKSPLDRYQSAEAFRADLLRVPADGSVAAAPVLPQQWTRGAGPPGSYWTFASHLGETSTVTVWRARVAERLERLGQSHTAVEDVVHGWRPPAVADLEIAVSRRPGGADDGHTVQLRGSAGEVEVPLRLPAGLDRAVARAAAAVDTARLSPALTSPADLAAVRDLGGMLFSAVLHGEAGALYRGCKAAAGAGDARAPHGRLLRLVLRPRAPEHAALPWELMFDELTGAHLALEHPLVRYVELPVPTAPPVDRPPLHVLGMAVSPRDMPPLGVDEERHAVESALGQLTRDGLVRLTWVNGQTWKDLQRKLYKRQYHMLHIVGHGGYHPELGEGFLAFADDRGWADPVSAGDLGAILAGQRQLRLAVLNTCESARGDGRRGYSSTAEALVRRGVGTVLSMRDVVSDPAARTFATVFYEAVAVSAPMDVAAMLARLAVKRDGRGSLEWSTPTLFMRSTRSSLFGTAEERHG